MPRDIKIINWDWDAGYVTVMAKKCKDAVCPDPDCQKEDVREESVDRLTRLLGIQPGKAENAAQRLRALGTNLKKDEVAQDVKTFKAIAHLDRLLMLKLLKEGEMCVCELMTAIGRPQSTTSHHLNILKRAGLVNERKVGQWSYYRISDGSVIDLMNHARLLKKK